MIFVLLVTKAPFNAQNAYSAYCFAEALLLQGKHYLKNIFFYCDGVYNANNNFITKDRLNLTQLWIELSIKYNIELFICVKSLVQRGLECEKILYKQNKHFMLINSNFKITNLVTLTNFILSCDRFVQF
ncbi:sulfurtransferase complex subunit TusD [Enterobacteriaceae endosymbiont of Macroplea appendiculata]|uniref:sulfurtransferase complex subunit TusD n=1 Tax=Enterobacteriaceae endosymbiont of Macroplea appendiculata TaxID=2675790 RepID=UPI00144A1DBB|nr:sulfurtransferase complex subunit TusD [Enterobacteriaceae endosymbiont of Macroplea appendiculata]QJC30934.1 sulfurtransferase complex subunit TusD [Enterobacteriaceae endosymbiont of Macroplea appendiculata]